MTLQLYGVTLASDYIADLELNMKCSNYLICLFVPFKSRFYQVIRWQCKGYNAKTCKFNVAEWREATHSKTDGAQKKIYEGQQILPKLYKVY